MRVNENIKRAREKIAMSQAGLAKLIGATEERVVEIELEDQDLQVSELYRIADAVGVSPAWLLAGKEEASLDREYDAVLRIYNKQDRVTVSGILVMNGYDVGQHKLERTKTGKVMDYFIHAKLRDANADTSR